MADKVAVVVGGGSGMGAAAARRLAADGFQVAVMNWAASASPVPTSPPKTWPAWLT